MCSHSKIVSYVFIILSCTTCKFQFFCSIFVLFCCSNTNDPRHLITYAIGAGHRFPPPAAPQDPMLALPFRRQWWRSRSGGCKCWSIPPPSHQRPIQYICPIQPVANQPGHKSQFLLILSSRYDPAYKTQSIQASRYDQSNKIHPAYHLIRKTHPNLPQLLIFSLPSGLCRQKSYIFLYCCIFCCLLFFILI